MVNAIETENCDLSLPVTGIGAYAFSSRTSLTSVTIGNSVTDLEFTNRINLLTETTEMYNPA